MDGDQNKQAPEEQKKRSPGKTISRVSIRLLLGGVAAILIAYAGIYGNFGHSGRLVAPWLMFIGLVLAAKAAQLELRNHHWKKRLYDLVFWGTVSVGLVFTIHLVRIEILSNQGA